MRPLIKQTFRNFKYKPAVRLINVLGLSASLVLVILLSTYCYSELTTDSQHVNGENIYLVKTCNAIVTPAILKENIDLKVPDVVRTIRVCESLKAPVFKAENSIPMESNLVFSDSDFFDFFTYKAMEGNLKTSLDNPYSIVISEKLKVKLFGDKPALGKTIKCNDKDLLTVTAVIKEPVKNSILSFSALTTIETKQCIFPPTTEFTEWGWANYETFVWLNKNANVPEITSKIHNLYPKNQGEWVESIELYALKDIYFAGFHTYGFSHFRQGDKSKVLILLLVGVLILVIAFVNFIHITSSQWYGQITKAGLLKVIGASRFSIYSNLVIESFLLFFMAICIAILCLLIILPIIQSYTGIVFNTHLLFSPYYIVTAIFLSFSLSILLSFIPGLKISSSSTIDNLKKSVTSKRNRSFVKGGMVTMQLVISIVLISFTLLVIKQIKYGSDNLVFNQDNTIAIKLTDQINSDVLKEELNKLPFVHSISFTEFYPGNEMCQWGGCILQLNGKEQDVGFSTFNADGNFFELMGLKLTMGQFYSNKQDTINNKAVVNEEFLKIYTIENPVGGIIFMADKKYEITGVVQDFHFKTVEVPINSLVITNYDYCPYCLVNIDADNFETLHNSLQEINNLTSAMSPSFPVEIGFLDVAVSHMYEKEVQFRRMFSLFAICAIIICAMGILAMSIFTAQNKIKEIGIRKVNGARITEVICMLNFSFLKWLVIAFIIATPIAWYVMKKWLEHFAYKTDVSWWIIALAGILALGIVILTVSWQSWKAAIRNPVEALRYE